jgi:tetratricopeptide (TPR) repeat protein
MSDWRISSLAKTDDAITEYRAAIKLAPNVVYLHVSLADFLAGQGKTEDAIAEYQTAIKLDPKSADAHYNLGRLLLGRVSNETPMGVRKAMLAEACQNFVTGAALAPTNSDYPLAMRSIDALLSGGKHCPPR